MSLPNWTINALTQLAFAIPVFLTYIGGIAAAIVFFRRCPPSAILTIVALLILFVDTAVGPVASNFIVAQRVALNLDFQKVGVALNAMGIILRLLQALGGILLITAVFRGRAGVTPLPVPSAAMPPSRVL
jgi:hypothetical protein